MSHRTLQEFTDAKLLLADGSSIYSVAQRLHLPVSTVRYWHRLSGTPRTLIPHPSWTEPADPAAYSYVLGLYLGDGCIGRTGAVTWQLSITLDAKYRNIIDEAKHNLLRVFPAHHVG